MANKIGVVLPASGTGDRCDSNIPKQYCLIDGKPLIYYTIQAFERVPDVIKIIVVTSEEYCEKMSNIISENKFSKAVIAKGCSTRHRSIAAGIQNLNEEETEIVVIHDAVRPIVPEPILQKVIHAAQKYGASGAVRPLTSTVISADKNGFLEKSLKRSEYKASEMPQAFHYSVIKSAYEKCTTDDFEFGTECLDLVLRYCDVKAKLIEGPPDLWKVTYKKDLYAAQGIIRELHGMTVVITHDLGVSEIVDELKQKLANKTPCKIFCEDKFHNNEKFTDVIFHHNKSPDEIKKLFQKRLCQDIKDNIISSIHIISSNKTNNNILNYSTLMNLSTDLVNFISDTDIKIYFIWMQNKNNKVVMIPKLVDYISSLLIERPSTFSGQVITL